METSADTGTQDDSNSIGTEPGTPPGAQPSPAERFAERVMPESAHGIRLKRRRLRFESVNFNVDRKFKTARRKGEPVEAPRFFDSEMVEAIFGGYTDSIELVAQCKLSPSGRPTLLLKDGQELQFIQDRPPVDGKPDPQANNVAAVFSSNKVTQQHAQLLLDGLEKNGRIIDIDKLEINGSAAFKRNMKAALFAEQERRAASVSGDCYQWGERHFKEYKDCAADGRPVNYEGQMVKINKEHPYAKALLQKSHLAKAVSDRVRFGNLPKPLISHVYGMIGSSSRDPKSAAREPDWERIATMVGIDPATAQVRPAPQPRPRAEMRM